MNNWTQLIELPKEKVVQRRYQEWGYDARAHNTVDETKKRT